MEGMILFFTTFIPGNKESRKGYEKEIREMLGDEADGVEVKIFYIPKRNVEMIRPRAKKFLGEMKSVPVFLFDKCPKKVAQTYMSFICA